MSAANKRQMLEQRAGQPAVAPDRDLRTAVELLRQLLVKQLELHDQLLACVHSKREAIRTANIKEMTACCEREHRLTERLRELDGRRPGIVQHLARLLGIAETNANSISAMEIAERLEEPSQGVIAALAAQLRDRLRDVKRAHSIVRSASEALGRHMSGIMQGVQAMLNQTGVYERRGRIVSTTPTISGGVDLKS